MQGLSAGLMGSDLIWKDALAGSVEWMSRQGAGAGRSIQGCESDVWAGGDWLGWVSGVPGTLQGEVDRGLICKKSPLDLLERLGVEFERGIAQERSD